MKKITTILALFLLCGASYGLDAGLNVSISSMSTNAVATTNSITKATDGYLKAISVYNPSNQTIGITITTRATQTLGVSRTLLSVSNSASALYYPVAQSVNYTNTAVSDYTSPILCRDMFDIVTTDASTSGCPLRITIVTGGSD